MSASSLVVATRHPAPATAPATVAPAQPYDGPRIAAADFFTLARQGRAVSAPPPFRDGDCALCPRGTEWMRHLGRWIIPGQPGGLTLPDEAVTAWWQTRTLPGSRFALVHRLTSEETPLITADHYTSHFRCLSVHDGAWASPSSHAGRPATASRSGT